MTESEQVEPSTSITSPTPMPEGPARRLIKRPWFATVAAGVGGLIVGGSAVAGCAGLIGLGPGPVPPMPASIAAPATTQ